MYYEPYRKPGSSRRRNRRRKSCLGIIAVFFAKLLALALVLSLVTAGVLLVLPVSLFAVERGTDLSLATDLPVSPLNVLVLGVDTLDKGTQRSDTMMIATIGPATLKLTSLQRDTKVQIPGKGSAKLNAAYAYGGAELAMRTVNETFDTNIMHYIVVDFTALVKMVDALGGIDVDITQEEMDHINGNVMYSGRVFGALGYTFTELKEYGENTHLNGLQALGYARIRKLDSDFMRTSRQRIVIGEMLEKLKVSLWNPLAVVGFLKAALESVQTDLSTLQLISLGEKALLAGGLEQMRLPVDGSFEDDGSSLSITDRGKNVSEFRKFVYG